MNKLILSALTIIPTFYLMAEELTLQIVYKVVMSNDSILAISMEQKLGLAFCPLRNYDLATYYILDDLVKPLFHISWNLAIEIMEWCNEYDTISGHLLQSLIQAYKAGH